jgi:protein-L-isoaspartate(D-aspartate) O-methyltransferase
LIERLRSEIPDERVIQAMERVPREEFVPGESRDLAYEDIPVPIGEGQTISQPFIVALMVRALELNRMDKVLEIGSGSGYQAAVMAGLAARVISVERIQSLADSAGERLVSLGYNSVEIVYAEKRLGWEMEAPYDAIIVAAGAPKLPQELMEQMAVGGRLVIPVGSLASQELMKVTRSAEAYSVETLGPCRFVPLLGEGAWPEEQSRS